jgi:hypothetical protein
MCPRGLRGRRRRRAPQYVRERCSSRVDGGKSPRIRVGPFVAVVTRKAIIFRNTHAIEFEVPSEEAMVANQPLPAI